MDGSLAIEENRQALKRIVAMLVEMAGLAEAAPFTSPSMGVRSGRPEAGRKPTVWLPERRTPGAMAEGRPVATQSREGVSDGADTPARRPDDHRPPLPELAEGPKVGRPAIPRLLWRAILRLLRPAESATRRLIIAAAAGITVPAPAPRQPKPQTMEPLLRKLGIAVMMPPGGLSAAAQRAKADGGSATASHRLTFPLFDPPRRLALYGQHHRHVPAHAAPRIWCPGLTEPAQLPPPPSPDDYVSAAHLTRRIAALSKALDDLPGQARRFARLKASREAASARRIFPIRRTRPPGGRLLHFDPNTSHPPRIREVDEILAHAHSLALYALENPDTS